MHKSNLKLFQCTWKVCTGQNIPLQHLARFKPKNPSTLEPTSYVTTLIKPTTDTWNIPLIASLYNKEEAKSILNILIPKTGPSES